MSRVCIFSDKQENPILQHLELLKPPPPQETPLSPLKLCLSTSIHKKDAHQQLHHTHHCFLAVLLYLYPPIPCSPKPGLEGSCKTHISPRNSGKGSPFNEKVFFFSLPTSIAKLIKMESNKKFHRREMWGRRKGKILLI